jgi:cation diffusion facilitator CzcD-associated flavoprotein CzcO
MDETAVAVVGAGPHGLAAAAHLRRAGTGYQVLDPARRSGSARSVAIR